MKRFLKSILQIIIVAIILIASAAIYGYFQTTSIIEFCKELPELTTPEQLIKLGKKKQFPVYNHLKKSGFIIVSNHDSPYFRYYCKIHFKEDKMVLKEAIVGD